MVQPADVAETRSTSRTERCDLRSPTGPNWSASFKYAREIAGGSGRRASRLGQFSLAFGSSLHGFQSVLLSGFGR
jgi:hypothetical protein